MFGVPVYRQGQLASWLPVRLTWWREGRTPTGQAVCLAWLVLKVPEGQGRHSPTLSAWLLFWKVPGGQGLGLGVPAGQ